MLPSGGHDAVILYSDADLHEAEELVAALETLNVRTWFAKRDVLYGDPVSSRVAEALEHVDRAIVSIGANGLSGSLRDIEISALLSMAAIKKVKIIPIFVGPPPRQPASHHPDPPHFLLSGLRPIDCRETGIRGNAELKALATQILRAAAPSSISADSGPLSSAPRATTSVPPLAPDPIERIIGRITKRLDTSGLVVGIGPHWPGNAIPRGEDVSLELLQRTLGWDEATRKLYARAPLLPAETAALAYSLANDLQDLVAEEVTRIAFAPRSFGIPSAFLELATLMTAIGSQSRAERGRAVIFTTNIDCSIERAFLQQGLAFTTFVFNLSVQKYRRTVFPAAARDGERRALECNGERLVAQGVNGLDGAALDRYQHQYASFIANGGESTTTTLSEFIHTLELNKLLRAFDARAGQDVDDIGAIDRPETPVVVKLLGSSMVEKSALVSSDRHYQLARLWERLGNVAKAAVTNDATIMAGYSLCDPVFWLLFDALLREPFRLSNHNVRYALLPRISTESEAGDHNALRRIVQEKVLSVPPAELHMIVEANVDEGDLFRRLGQAVTSLSHSPWD